MKTLFPALLLPLFLPLAAIASEATTPKPLVVHEWGTFTSLQDESGQAIGGLNTDDEPVPKAVLSITIDWDPPKSNGKLKLSHPRAPATSSSQRHPCTPTARAGP